MTFEPYFLIKLLHLLLFVYWLGADVGVFYSSGLVRNRTLSVEARRTALQILGWIDQIPRYCMVLMLPVGYSLAYTLGVVRLRSVDFLVMWLVGLLWLALVWFVHRWQGTARGQRLRRVDLVWRWILAAGLCWDAWQGWHGRNHLLTTWLAAKFAIFAALVFCGILIRVRGAALGPALRELLSTGSTPAVEAAITSGFARTRPIVILIWLLLALAAYIGISKPTFGL